MLPDAAGLHAVLSRHEIPHSCVNEGPQKLLIEWLYEAHVDDKGACTLPCRHREGKERAEGEDRGVSLCSSHLHDPRPGEADFRAKAVRDYSRSGRLMHVPRNSGIVPCTAVILLHRDAKGFPCLGKLCGLGGALIPRAFRIAHCDRTRVRERRVKHRPEVADEPRGHDDHVGNGQKERDVEHSLVRRPVGAHDAGVVDGDDDREVRERDVMHDLVIGSLQERGVDADDGPHAARRKPRGEGDGMLLGYRDVKELLRVLPGELLHPRALAHRRGDGAEP